MFRFSTGRTGDQRRLLDSTDTEEDPNINCSNNPSNYNSMDKTGNWNGGVPEENLIDISGDAETNDVDKEEETTIGADENLDLDRLRSEQQNRARQRPRYRYDTDHRYNTIIICQDIIIINYNHLIFKTLKFYQIRQVSTFHFLTCCLRNQFNLNQNEPKILLDR